MAYSFMVGFVLHKSEFLLAAQLNTFLPLPDSI